MKDGRETLTIPQAAVRAGVSVRTIQSWILKEQVQYVRTAGGGIRIFSDTLWRLPIPNSQSERTAP